MPKQGWITSGRGTCRAPRGGLPVLTRRLSIKQSSIRRAGISILIRETDHAVVRCVEALLTKQTEVRPSGEHPQGPVRTSVAGEISFLRDVGIAFVGRPEVCRGESLPGEDGAIGRGLRMVQREGPSAR
jgi:hypothetical protein